MNQPSLEVFERDLYAACAGKDALLLDVRNNGGGWTTDRVLASIMAPVHAWTTPRGADPAETGHYPQDRLFIQRTTMPINLLCNEKSYSNAEIMSHAFKTVGRGTLVVPRTVQSSQPVRSHWKTARPYGCPSRYVADQEPTDMELNGAVPDLLVPQTPKMNPLRRHPTSGRSGRSPEEAALKNISSRSDEVGPVMVARVEQDVDHWLLFVLMLGSLNRQHRVRFHLAA